MVPQDVRYSASSITLHWLMFLVIATAVALGMSLSRAAEGWGDTLYRLHWSFGLAALGLAVVRLFNRLVMGTPPEHPTLTRLESVVSTFVHRALYVLMLVVPMLGWLGKSAYGGAITVFGLFNMPALLAQNEALSKKLLGAHGMAVKLLMLCIALHIAGALNHALIKRDGLIWRMLPRLRG